ncbi:plasmid stabilization system protein [Pasteurellaceae bacterium Orientalotternb1]|nr:plasmid stabilization system protein [Pasteurellaceae bacterium Orientalotternb1]
MANWVLSPNAETELREIMCSVAYFTGYWTSAVNLFEELQNKFELIAFMPQIGVEREDGSRETFCRGYRIVYEISGENVKILTVIHSRRLYPRP